MKRIKNLIERIKQTKLQFSIVVIILISLALFLLLINTLLIRVSTPPEEEVEREVSEQEQSKQYTRSRYEELVAAQPIQDSRYMIRVILEGADRGTIEVRYLQSNEMALQAALLILKQYGIPGDDPRVKLIPSEHLYLGL